MSGPGSFENDDERKRPARERDDRHVEEGDTPIHALASPTSKGKSKASTVIRPVKAKVGKRTGEGTRKPKDMPRRPLSAYNYFFRECREQLMTETPKGNTYFQGQQNSNNPELFGQLGKVIAKRWKEISPEDHEKYKKMAAADMERYCSEMSEYRLKRAKHSRLSNAEPMEEIRTTERPGAALSGALSERPNQSQYQSDPESFLLQRAPSSVQHEIQSMSANSLLCGSRRGPSSAPLQYLPTSTLDAARAPYMSSYLSDRSTQSQYHVSSDDMSRGLEASLLQRAHVPLQYMIPTMSAGQLQGASSLLNNTSSTPLQFLRASSRDAASAPNLMTGLPSASLPMTDSELFRLGLMGLAQPASVRNSLMPTRTETDAVGVALSSRDIEIERLLALQQQQQRETMQISAALQQSLLSQSPLPGSIPTFSSSSNAAAAALASRQNHHLTAAISSSEISATGAHHSGQHPSNQQQMDDSTQFLLLYLQAEQRRRQQQQSGQQP